MSAADKKPYLDQHQTDRERFTKEMSNLSPDQQTLLRQITRARRKHKRANFPKPPLSQFMFFVKSNRQDIIDKAKTDGQQLTFQDTGKLLGQKWRSMSEKEREPYQKMFEKDKYRYQKELAILKKKSSE